MNTREVYGIQRDLPVNYIVRNVDQIFLDCLDREHHIVIFGSSKQGKTSLRKKNLRPDEYIILHCNNKWDLYNLNINILKLAGYTVDVSESKTTTGRSKVKASLTFGIPWLGKVDVEPEVEVGKQTQKNTKELELDPEDVNDVIAALSYLQFDKYIILEDFHYLKPETQTDFSIELKAFHENSKITFIVIGVWLEENRLIALNGDLAGRIKSVNADEWTDDNLTELIATGEALLNIRFSEEQKKKIIDSSLNNVYIVQEVCYKLCIENGVKEKQQMVVDIDCCDIDILISEVISQHSGRYNSFIASVCDGFQKTELEMYRWIMFALINTSLDSLEKGLRRGELNAILQEHHPKKDELNSGNLTQALKSIASLQVKKSITPIILDYDNANLRLNIVDKGFLIWFNNQDKQYLLEELGFTHIK